MTNREQRKLQKRKAKEKEDYQKLLLQREKRTKERQVLAKEKKELEAIRKDKLQQQRLEAWAEAVAEKLSPEATRQIEHNIEILKALEQEYQAELDAKRALNEGLESEGAISIEEKLNNIQKKNEVGVGGSAECSFSINKEENEESH